jgi:uncharacterized membrane protein
MQQNDSAVSVMAAFYSSEHDAHLMLKSLEQMQRDGAVNLLDAAVMVREGESGKLKIKETAEVTARKGAAAGAVVGGIIGIIFPPSILATAAIGAAAGAALGHFTDQGFKNNLLKEIGENLPPGGSAIVAVVEETWFERASAALRGYARIARYAADADAAARFTTGSQ